MALLVLNPLSACPDFDALRQKEDTRIQLQRTEARLKAIEKDRDRWKQLSQQKALNREKVSCPKSLFANSTRSTLAFESLCLVQHMVSLVNLHICEWISMK